MKIMDPDIRKTHVHSKPLRVYESNLITFPDNKVPFTRIFSHHAQCCYANAINKGWILPKEPPPPHFGSPLKDVTLQCQLGDMNKERVPFLLSPPTRTLVNWNDSSHLTHFTDQESTSSNNPKSDGNDDQLDIVQNLFSEKKSGDY